MGDDPMRKADLMDEIRSKIGVVADKLEGDIEALYRYVIETLYEHVPTYRYVGIYLTHGYEFVRFHHAGYSSHPPVIRFGQGLHSLAAARGKLVRERVGRWTEVLVPFYRGHHHRRAGCHRGAGGRYRRRRSRAVPRNRILAGGEGGGVQFFAGRLRRFGIWKKG